MTTINLITIIFPPIPPDSPQRGLRPIWPSVSRPGERRHGVTLQERRKGGRKGLSVLFILLSSSSLAAFCSGSDVTEVRALSLTWNLSPFMRKLYGLESVASGLMCHFSAKEPLTDEKGENGGWPTPPHSSTKILSHPFYIFTQSLHSSKHKHALVWEITEAEPKRTFYLIFLYISVKVQEQVVLVKGPMPVIFQVYGPKTQPISSFSFSLSLSPKRAAWTALNTDICKWAALISSLKLWHHTYNRLKMDHIDYTENGSFESVTLLTSNFFI